METGPTGHVPVRIASPDDARTTGRLLSASAAFERVTAVHVIETGAGLEPEDFQARVEVTDDVERTLLTVASECDVVTVGATRSGAITQALTDLPETVAAVDGTVVIARGPDETPLSIRDAIGRRLEV